MQSYEELNSEVKGKRIKHLERKRQVERIYTGKGDISCILRRVECPECGAGSMRRTTGFQNGGAARIKSSDTPKDNVKFRCEVCSYTGKVIHDKKEGRNVRFERYSEILKEEI